MKDITKQERVKLPTKYGDFVLHVYECDGGINHLALTAGELSGTTLVRVHSECATGDIFHSLRCDCGEQLEQALKQIAREGGVLLYLRQEGRGIGLLNKIKAYQLQDRGLDTVEANEQLGFKADMRDYTVGVKILADLGVKNIKLMTNNPKKIEGLEKYGITIVERVPLEIKSNANNKRYLHAKKEKLGHYLEDGGFVK